MPAPGPVLIQYIMSKLLLAAAPIETLIKAIKGSSWGGAWGEEAVSCVYTGVAGRVSVHGCLKGNKAGDHLWLWAEVNTSSLQPPSSPLLGDPVHSQQWLFHSGRAWLGVIYSSAAAWSRCGDQLLHISTETGWGGAIALQCSKPAD